MHTRNDFDSGNSDECIRYSLLLNRIYYRPEKINKEKKVEMKSSSIRLEKRKKSEGEMWNAGEYFQKEK